jgi:hypothetical protein
MPAMVPPPKGLDYQRLRELRAQYLAGSNPIKDSHYKEADKLAAMDYGKSLEFSPLGVIFSIFWLGYVKLVSKGISLIVAASVFLLLIYIFFPDGFRPFCYILTIAGMGLVGTFGFRWRWEHIGKTISEKWAESGGDFDATRASLSELGSNNRAGISEVWGSFVGMVVLFFVIISFFPMCDGFRIEGMLEDITREIIGPQLGLSASEAKTDLDVSISDIDTEDRGFEYCRCSAWVAVYSKKYDDSGVFLGDYTITEPTGKDKGKGSFWVQLELSSVED